MRDDTNRMRPNPETRPWVMTNLNTLDGLADVVAFIEKRGMLGSA
jgi:urease accessory protein